MATGTTNTPQYAYLHHPALDKPYVASKYATQESFDDALSHKAHPGEVYVCSFPKCGTTWLMNALYIMSNEGKTLDSHEDLNVIIPHLEYDGRSAVENVKKNPKIVKTHLYFDLTPWNDEAKYIFVARNPKDCFTSFYYHTIGFTNHYNFSGSFGEYFECVINGKVDSGDYFKCVGEWFERSKTKKNILFLLYEDMKEDMEREILKVADFLGREWGQKVRKNDNELLKKVIEGCSFENMRQKGKFSSPRPKDLPFIRKGIVGDWKNLFTEEQAQRVEERMKEYGKMYPGFDHIWDKY